MTVPYRKKLIEVGLPLVVISAQSAREKSIRHGHPSTHHLWWPDPFDGDPLDGDFIRYFQNGARLTL
jgi:hypothetical protein